MNIILVRHGQTDWNINALLQGSTDVELNETGRAQAEATAEKLKDVSINQIYVSPLGRTIETAKQINKFHQKQLITDSRLLERGFGDHEGSSGFDIKPFWNYGTNLSSDNIEPIRAFFERVYQFLAEIEARYGKTDQNILLVTHNGVNLAVSCILSGVIPKNIFENNMEPCEIKIFKNPTLNNWKSRTESENEEYRN